MGFREIENAAREEALEMAKHVILCSRQVSASQKALLMQEIDEFVSNIVDAHISAENHAAARIKPHLVVNREYQQ